MATAGIGAESFGRRRAAAAATAHDAALTADLELIRDGDEAAFSRLFRAVQPGLIRYLTVLVGLDAEDVASETWAQAVRDLRRFRGDADDFRGWIARIGRNRAIDHLRAHSRRPAAPAQWEDLDVRVAAEDTELLALESLSTDAAVAAIATLPRDQAEAVLLRAVMGLDAVAAGKVLGKRPGAVRTAAYRGLQRLATQLAEPAEAPGCDTSGPGDADEVR